jgi:N-carbamoyl-L-amino-acid hydrolase
MSHTHITLNQINTLPHAEAAALLSGLYEHSDWIAAQALDERPFASAASLKHAMVKALQHAGHEPQLALVRAHPELAGKAMVSKSLTAESTHEQTRAGLTHCSPQEFAHIQQLNASYNAKFGFPFILAVRGPRGSGLNKQQIISTFERRLHNHPDYELAECLRNIHRIVEIRLNDKLGYEPALGHEVWDWHEWLAQFSDVGAINKHAPHAAREELTVTYLTDAHLKCARTIELGMRACGFDEVHIDAVGNVVGVYKAASTHTTSKAKTLMTGSHYDTVRNGGKYDGRLGIFVPMACVRELARAGQRLPFNLEVVGFAEEEGQRYKATFLGSGALVGDFKNEWLDQKDADGITMRQAMKQAGLKIEDIPKLTRNAAQYLGFVEVHIEQGLVLNELDIPLGVVTSINGSVRFVGEVIGMASHAGTTPMDRRRDAATAVAELALFVEKRAAQIGHTPDVAAHTSAVTGVSASEPSQACACVGTVGQLNVPNGSINVVPGRCQFSLDLRATTNELRDSLMHDVLAELKAICERRGLHYTLEETMRASAAPSDAKLRGIWEQAVQSLGVPVFHLPSGAGHDAMKLHEVMPQAMLFVRGQNAGISHNPLESTTSDDIQLAVDAFMHLLHKLHA